MIIISALIPLTLLLIVAYFCARAIWRATTIPAELLRGERCGKCSYDLGGAGATHCPECGADLYDAGLITPIMQLERRPGGLAAAIAWTVLAMILAAVLLATVVTIVESMPKPAISRLTASTWFMPAQARGQPAAEASRYSVKVSSDVVRADDRLDRGTVLIEVTADGGAAASVELDAVTLLPVGNSEEVGARAFDRAGALTLMRAAGLDTSLRSIQDQADHLAQIARTAKDGAQAYPMPDELPPSSSYLVGHSRTTTISNVPSQSSPFPVIAAIAASIAAWIAGLLAIRARRRSLRDKITECSA